MNIDELVNTYSDLLFRYVLVRVNDTETARDLVQETFITAWRNRETFRGEVSEKNWLFTILKSRLIDHYRKKGTRLSTQSIDSADSFFQESGHWKNEEMPKPWEALADQRIRSQEFHSALEHCKGKLKELQNIVFTMKYLEDKNSDEICKELNITTSNYWVLLHRAKLQLRKCLETQHILPGYF